MTQYGELTYTAVPSQCASFHSDTPYLHNLPPPLPCTRTGCQPEWSPLAASLTPSLEAQQGVGRHRYGDSLDQGV